MLPANDMNSDARIIIDGPRVSGKRERRDGFPAVAAEVLSLGVPVGAH